MRCSAHEGCQAVTRRRGGRGEEELTGSGWRMAGCQNGPRAERWEDCSVLKRCG